jgi:hypothetical protein
MSTLNVSMSLIGYISETYHYVRLGLRGMAIWQIRGIIPSLPKHQILKVYMSVVNLLHLFRTQSSLSPRGCMRHRLVLVHLAAISIYIHLGCKPIDARPTRRYLWAGGPKVISQLSRRYGLRIRNISDQGRWTFELIITDESWWVKKHQTCDESISHAQAVSYI